MRITPELLPVLQITLPLIAAILGAAWLQNKRIDDLRSEMKAGFEALNKRIDEIIKRLDRIDSKLETHGERIAKLEGPPLVHR